MTNTNPRAPRLSRAVRMHLLSMGWLCAGRGEHAEAERYFGLCGIAYAPSHPRTEGN